MLTAQAKQKNTSMLQADWMLPNKHRPPPRLKKLAAVIGGLEYRRCPAAVEDGGIYNVYSAKELIEEGLSEDVELRLFEAGARGGRLTFVARPLFLVDEPAALIRLWAAIPRQLPENRMASNAKGDQS